MTNEIDSYIIEQQKLLAEMVANGKRDIELRQVELIKQDELTRAYVARTQADESLVAERKITNRLAEEHNAVIAELIVKLTRVLVYLESGTFPQRIDEIVQSQNLIVRTIESLILMSLGRGNVTSDDLLELIKSGVIQDNAQRSKSGTFNIHKEFINETFVNLLLNCITIANNIDDLINEISPVDIKYQVKSPNHKTKVIQFVTAIGIYNAWSDLIRVLNYFEGESLGVIAVKEYLTSTAKI